jgi:hypothetical protein
LIIPGSITVALACGSVAHAQVQYLSDLRRVSLTADTLADREAFAISPAVPYSDFEVASRTVDAATGTTSVSATGSHHSVLSPSQMTASGAASAAGLSLGSDPGSAQSSSSFFVGFRLATPQRLVAHAALTRGVTSNAQFILQRTDGTISYVLNADSPQPITINRILPAGEYRVVAFASASIALFPGANLADGCAYTAELAFTCPVDFNADGFLDFFDYDEYVTCFETGACPPQATADFNDDGFVDFFDYDDFVASYEAGC